MSDGVETGTIRTRIPARLDRLPWSRFHWIVIVGPRHGLDPRRARGERRRLDLQPHLRTRRRHRPDAGDVSGWAASLYIAGACLGAIVFGQLTDRFGRKRLFMVTLGIYLTGTVLTALTFSPAWFFACRFLTGMGIGGEYSAINSAIDELIPAKPARPGGRLDQRQLLARRHRRLAAGRGDAEHGDLPRRTSAGACRSCSARSSVWRCCWCAATSPRARAGCSSTAASARPSRSSKDIERQVSESTGEELPEPEGEPLTVRQRQTIPLPLIVRSVVTLYPRRTILGLSLFIGQAFLYNSILFGFGNLLSLYFHTPSGNVPYYLAVFAAGNFAGALLLSPLFDTLGRKPMIAGTYLLSGALLIVTGLLFRAHDLNDVDASRRAAAWCSSSPRRARAPPI